MPPPENYDHLRGSEIPEDILKKRAKKAGKKEGEEAAPLTEEEAAKKKAAAAKSSKAARAKKLKKQLEGLDLAEKLMRDLMRAGLGTMGGAALKTYEQLSKQLGDYYLPGPQRLLNGLILEIAAFQKDGNESHYDSATAVLEKFWTLVRKSKQYLSDKLERGDEAPDDNELYEELGGVCFSRPFLRAFSEYPPGSHRFRRFFPPRSHTAGPVPFQAAGRLLSARTAAPP